MPEFKVQCEYLRKEKMKFFNDKESKEYHGFLVVNPEIIPDGYVYFTEKRMKPCWIWILGDLVKRTGVDFGEPLKATKDYKFVISLGGKKAAKFSTNNRNEMVLKTKDYFENTVKKIGFWDSEDYFYESKNQSGKPTKKPNSNNPVQSEKKNNYWTKIALVCLPIIIIAFFSFLIIKWVSKKNNKI